MVALCSPLPIRLESKMTKVEEGLVAECSNSHWREEVHR